MYKIILSKLAAKDQKLLKTAGLSLKAKKLVDQLERYPFQTPPYYEQLCGNLKGTYSRRINIQHRLVYEVLENTENIKDENDTPYEGVVRVLRMWTHYE